MSLLVSLLDSSIRSQWHFYSLGSEIFQEVSDAKYLGIQIDNKLDWNKHISTVAALVLVDTPKGA